MEVEIPDGTYDVLETAEGVLSTLASSDLPVETTAQHALEVVGLVRSISEYLSAIPDNYQGISVRIRNLKRRAIHECARAFDALARHYISQQPDVGVAAIHAQIRNAIL